jgi:uncharacterized protein YlzI (FlbEa/FlbD family)
MKYLNGVFVTVTLVGTVSSAEPVDLVVYGGSSAGIAAAIQVKKMGGSVIVIEPSTRIGGLTTGGLGQTDVGNKHVIGGLARRFYQDVRSYYEKPESWKWMKREEFYSSSLKLARRDEDALWVFEPSVALSIYQDWVNEHDIEIVFGERLDRTGEGKAEDRGDGYWVAKPGKVAKGVVKEGNRITAIVMESGRTFSGKMFMDATYEGDLLASAGVSFTVGREGKAIHGETLNGVQAGHARSHQLVKGVDPYVKAGDPSSGLLYGIDPEGPGKEFSSDHRIQAFCFRMCLTDHEENRIPFKKPDGYQEEWYELLFRNYEAGHQGVPWINSTMPNRKTDTNNGRGFSTDFIGMNYEWPQGSYEKRAELRTKHLLYQQGLMWTLANHPRVPERVRAVVSNWGMTKDEFQEGGGWQEQLYVREGRRMISELVMTQDHCQHVKEVEDSVGMGAYNMDSHHTQRYVTKEGYARNEGDVQVRVKPYPVSYQSIVPKEDECANLVVPIALSASHIAFGSIRMEPVFMILAQSGATAAMQAIQDGTALQRIDYGKLRERLVADGQILIHEESALSLPARKMKGIIADDGEAELTGDWRRGRLKAGVNDGYHFLPADRKTPAKALYRLKPDRAGKYQVQVSGVPRGSRSSRTLVRVNGKEFRINQKQVGSVEGLWAPVTIISLESAAVVVVEISNEGADGPVIADAVRLIPTE